MIGRPSREISRSNSIWTEGSKLTSSKYPPCRPPLRKQATHSKCGLKSRTKITIFSFALVRYILKAKYQLGLTLPWSLWMLSGLTPAPPHQKKEIPSRPEPSCMIWTCTPHQSKYLGGPWQQDIWNGKTSENWKVISDAGRCAMLRLKPFEAVYVIQIDFIMKTLTSLANSKSFSSYTKRMISSIDSLLWTWPAETKPYSPLG